jgi:hypothetical protein
MMEARIEILLHLMQWAVALTGYDYPTEMPMIAYSDNSHFVEVLCDGVDTPRDPCDTRAYYDDERDAMIVLNTKYFEIGGEWTPHERGIILHEMVHYLQDLSGRWNGYQDWEDSKLCRERQFRQKEAYEAQDEYMLRVYNIRRRIPRFYGACGE